MHAMPLDGWPGCASALQKATFPRVPRGVLRSVEPLTDPFPFRLLQTSVPAAVSCLSQSKPPPDQQGHFLVFFHSILPAQAVSVACPGYSLHTAYPWSALGGHLHLGEKGEENLPSRVHAAGPKVLGKQKGHLSAHLACHSLPAWTRHGHGNRATGPVELLPFPMLATYGTNPGHHVQSPLARWLCVLSHVLPPVSRTIMQCSMHTK